MKEKTGIGRFITIQSHDKRYEQFPKTTKEQKVNVDCNNLENAKKLFECLNFEELVEVKYHILVMEKNGIELAFQYGENIGTLIEYENINDFSDKTIDEIKVEKENMQKFIKDLGLEITEEIDVKKAWELIEKNYKF